MNTFTKVGTLLVLAATVVFGLLARGSAQPKPELRTAEPVQEIARVWSATQTEQLALAGIAGMVQNMDAQVAPIITDSQMRARVLAFLAQGYGTVYRAQRELVEETGKQHGLDSKTIAERLHYDPATTSWTTSGS